MRVITNVITKKNIVEGNEARSVLQSKKFDTHETIIENRMISEKMTQKWHECHKKYYASHILSLFLVDDLTVFLIYM